MSLSSQFGEVIWTFWTLLDWIFCTILQLPRHLLSIHSKNLIASLVNSCGVRWRCFQALDFLAGCVWHRPISFSFPQGFPNCGNCHDHHEAAKLRHCRSGMIRIYTSWILDSLSKSLEKSIWVWARETMVWTCLKHVTLETSAATHFDFGRSHMSLSLEPLHPLFGFGDLFSTTGDRTQQVGWRTAALFCRPEAEDSSIT